MPNWIGMRLRWALASTAALFAVALLCAPAQAIIGGASITISAAPYQVALVHADRNSNFNGQFCGGAISPDGHHVITAAHCVFDFKSGQAIAPGTIDVVAGTATLDSSKTNRIRVTGIAFMPQFNAGTLSHDAAVLTLGAPISGAAQQLFGILDDSSVTPTPPARATVSGWGQTTNTPSLATDYVSPTLKAVEAPFLDESKCAQAYSGYALAYMQCAGSSSVDACFGDSGGPLVLKGGLLSPNTDQLIGIVSYGGDLCADPSHPGVYTQATEATTRNFILSSPVQDAPRNVAPPALEGQANVGSTVRCGDGAWSGSPMLAYQFESSTRGVAVARTASSPTSTYVVQAGDAGSTIDCIVKASNAAGFAVVKSAAVAVPVPPVAPKPPAPQPAPVPQPAPKPVPQTDSAAPVARITSKRCKSNRCTLNVLVSDAGFSAGIAGVQVTVRSRYRGTCVLRHRRVACTRTRTRKLAAKLLSGTRYRVTATKLPFGRNVFTLLAVDRANHVQALPTRATLVTGRKKR